MDFHNAVHWHVSWLQEMLSDIQTPHKLNPEKIAQDDLCELGRWIYSVSTQVSELPEYKELKSVHAQMHRSVADAVSQAQSGKLRESEQYLSVAGECIETSKHLLDHCDKLIKIINEDAHK